MIVDVEDAGLCSLHRSTKLRQTGGPDKGFTKRPAESTPRFSLLTYLRCRRHIWARRVSTEFREENFMAANRIRPTALVFCAALFAAFTAVSSNAAVVWDLNPSDQNAPVGSSSHTFTSSGYSITAYGFDNHSG